MPYELVPGITYIVVWLKHRRESEPLRQYNTQRAQLEKLVRRKFFGRVHTLPGRRYRVQWFKSWTALQSVPGLEYLHAVIRDTPRRLFGMG